LFDRAPAHAENTLKLRLGVPPGRPWTLITDLVCQNSLGCVSRTVPYLTPNFPADTLADMRQIPRHVCEELKYYVYLYIDPRDGRPFYVGKGKRGRLLTHLKDRSETEKTKRIEELDKLDLKPVIEILKYGLTEKEAFLVESATIDLLGIGQLTNRVKGHHAVRGLLQDIVDELDAKEVEIMHPVILINISQLYRYGMSPLELYDATRSAWKVGPRRHKAKYAFAVYGGNVRAVYFIAAWLPAGSTMLTRKHSAETRLAERFEFVGTLAPDKIQRRYLGKSVRHYFAPGSQNPIKYVNC
jgi:hypothetical protein